MVIGDLVWIRNVKQTKIENICQTERTPNILASCWLLDTEHSLNPVTGVVGLVEAKTKIWMDLPSRHTFTLIIVTLSGISHYEPNCKTCENVEWIYFEPKTMSICSLELSFLLSDIRGKKRYKNQIWKKIYGQRWARTRWRNNRRDLFKWTVVKLEEMFASHFVWLRRSSRQTTTTETTWHYWNRVKQYGRWINICWMANLIYWDWQIWWQTNDALVGECAAWDGGLLGSGCRYKSVARVGRFGHNVQFGLIGGINVHSSEIPEEDCRWASRLLMELSLYATESHFLLEQNSHIPLRRTTTNLLQRWFVFFGCGQDKTG